MAGEYPECEKLAEKAKESAVISNFLEWLEENDISLVRDWEGYQGVGVTTSEYNQLLARYYDIDLNKVEDERRDILASLQ